MMDLRCSSGSKDGDISIDRDGRSFTELHIHSDRNAKGVEHSSCSLATDSTGYLAGAVAIERVVGEREQQYGLGA